VETYKQTKKTYYEVVTTVGIKWLLRGRGWLSHRNDRTPHCL